MSPLGEAVARRRFASQLLTGVPASTPEAVVERILAVQAQDSRGARLAIRARSRGLNSGDVDNALTQSRSLVVSWLNRGTLHLVRAEDYWWLHPLTTPQLSVGIKRRLAVEGVEGKEADRGVDIIVASLQSEGPLTRAELRGRLDQAGVPTGGQALVHLLAAATLSGGVIRGPLRNGQPGFVLAAQWLKPPPSPIGRTEALARLASRYLQGHSPASPRDLARWAGIRLTDARAGFEAIRDASVDIGDGLLNVRDRAQAVDVPKPMLLGQFDPLLHGWESREFVVAGHGELVTSNGLFRPFALVKGRAAGIWSLDRGRVNLRPFEPIGLEDSRALEADAANVLSFISPKASLPSSQR